MTTTPDLFANRYQIEAQLGRGSFGFVQRALDTRLKRTVALKIPNRLLSSDEEFLRTFIEEAQTAAALSHPNIVTIYDVGESEEHLPYLAMRYLEGQSLQALLARDKLLRLDRSLKILDQLAGALDYLQEQRLVHRDIKPANIMIGARDQATLMDFGLARVIAGSHLSLSGALAFTPLYASPEQAVGERLTPASDRYSLAVIAYEMLAGRAPHANYDNQILLHAIRYDEPPPADEVNHALSPAVSRILQAALAKEPADRPPTAEIFVQDLRTALGSRLAYLMRDLRSAIEPHVANLFKPESQSPSAPAGRPAQQDASDKEVSEYDAVDPAGVEPDMLKTVPLLPASDEPQAWTPPKLHRATQSLPTSPVRSNLPNRVPDELERFGAAGVKQVAVFGRNSDACPACAAARGQTHQLQTAPELPLHECTSKWGCHCEYVPIVEEGQELPEGLLVLLDAGQRHYYDLLRLRAACARGESQEIRIDVEPSACPDCRGAAHAYAPNDVPLLPLATCKRYPSCECHYRLIPSEVTEYAKAGAKRIAVFGRNSDTCPACATVRAQTFPPDMAPELPLRDCSSASGCNCKYAPLVEEGKDPPVDLLALLDSEQLQYLKRLRLQRICAQGEAQQIEIVAESDACPSCQAAAHAYGPADVPLLPLVNCTHESHCACRYQLVKPPQPQSGFRSIGGALRWFSSILQGKD